MPNFCAVFGCGNNGERNHDKSFYRIPAVPKKGSDMMKSLSEERCKAWLQALKRADIGSKKIEYFRICSDHFISGKPSELQDKLNPDWVPSVKMGYEAKDGGSSMDRFKRSQKRKLQLEDLQESSRRDELPVLPVLPPDPPENSTEQELNDDVKFSCGTQANLCCENYKELQTDWRRSQDEISKLTKQIANLQISENSFKNDNAKVLYFTGIPSYLLLSQVFALIAPYVPRSFTALTQFQQFMLVMMRLRLNLDLTDLSFRFGVSRRTVSRVFDVWISVMYKRLQPLIHWPDRSELVASMPSVFKECFDDRVTNIIDCFEIFIERPSGPLASAQCWSNYKHHHTMKFLIGITPQGTVSFISKAWGGRASDKHITENCGFLDKLVPGDVVLADRGFTCQDSARLMCATIEMPAFTKGRKQLSPFELESTRNLAHVRIHVERIIGTLRQKFTILEGTWPISMLTKHNSNVPQIDEIVHVCCALINLCPTIIPN